MICFNKIPGWREGRFNLTNKSRLSSRALLSKWGYYDNSKMLNCTVLWPEISCEAEIS